MILDQLAEAARRRVARQKAAVSYAKMRRLAEEKPQNTLFPFAAALQKPGISLICEVKKASPSRGVLRPDFPYREIAKSYEQAGADALSVLTEPDFFQGCDQYLTEIAQDVGLPVLRKDFILEPYQIYQAKAIGAHALLLICALLTPDQLTDYLALAHELGLSVLTEAHTAAEVQTAVDAGAGIIGINNRDLHDFSVSLETSLALLGRIPKDRIKVSESGIFTPDDVRRLREAGADAVLVGEAVVTQEDPAQKIASLKGAAS